MAAVVKKDWGRIEVTDGVIAKLAGLTATECMGVLGLASSDGWTDLLKKDSVDRGVRINSNEDTIKIEINNTDSVFGTLLSPVFSVFGASTAGTIYSLGYTLLVGILLNFVFGIFCSRLMLSSLSKFKCFKKRKLYGGAEINE